MTKNEFLLKLGNGLCGLPQSDIDEHLAFYGEIIDDMTEDGLSEEQAVEHIGDTDEIILQIISDTPITKIVKEKIKSRRKPTALEIVLIVLGFPLWFPLIIAAIAVVLSLYVSLWAVIVSFWAVFVSFLLSGIAGILLGLLQAVNVNLFRGMAFMGAGLFLVGLSILTFMFCKIITVGMAKLTKAFFVWLKNRFVKKGEV